MLWNKVLKIYLYNSNKKLHFLKRLLAPFSFIRCCPFNPNSYTTIFSRVLLLKFAGASEPLKKWYGWNWGLGFVPQRGLKGQGPFGGGQGAKPALFKNETRICTVSSGVAIGVARGAECHPWQRKICQQLGKRGEKSGKIRKKSGKIRKKRQNREV